MSDNSIVYKRNGLIWLVFMTIILLMKIPQLYSENQYQTADLFQKEMISSSYVAISKNEVLKGYITSPNYPNPLPINSSTILALISGNSNYSTLTAATIRLTFVDLHLETSNFCENEVLEVLIKDKEDSESPQEPWIANKLIYKVCGSVLPRPLLIRGDTILLHLYSDAFNSAKSRGFKIKFEFLSPFDKSDCEPPDYFRCRNRECISSRLKCDRFDDCGDASDEDMFTPCENLPTISYKINYQCGRRPTTNSLQGNRRKKQGQKSLLIQNRIIGGLPVSKVNGWPFSVSIQFWRIESISHQCGGTLIHPMFVISAAHCFRGLFPASDYKLIFGARDLANVTREKQDVQVRYINFITLFPGSSLLLDLNNMYYAQADLTQDLALIELNAPVKLTNNVWPACLPHINEPIQVHRRCLTSGFGETRGTNKAFQQKQVVQIIQANSQCKSPLSDMDIDEFSMICVTSSPGEGPCNGDSGGPLFCADGLDHRPVDMDPNENGLSETIELPYKHLKPGDVIRYLPLRTSPSYKLESSMEIDRRKRKTYTIHGITSFSTAGNLGGGFCGVQNVSTAYTRVSTKVEWILSQMKLALFRLNKADCVQDPQNSTAFFGYMFRTGVSRHVNFTTPMTVFSND